MKTLRHLFAATVSALVFAVVAPAVAAAAPTAPAVDYVNLGDSYSAGSGVVPTVPGAPAQCSRSQRNFAHIVAGARRFRLTDVSCASAQTDDLYRPQPGATGTRAQLDALRPSTDVVTVMLGGNDSGTFNTIVSGCLRATLTVLGVDDPCRRTYGRSLVDPIGSRIRPALVKGLRAIHQKAPNARVYVVGYPAVFPRSGDCSGSLLLRAGDTPYVRTIADTLNGAIRDAAQATGSVFVDMVGVSDAHNACTSPTVRYVEPIIGTTQFPPVHPNARGERAIAKQVLAAIG